MRHLFCLLLVAAVVTFPAVAQTTILNEPTAQLVIPAAGSVAGANGTFFRSDVSITNFAATDQLVTFRWLTSSGQSPDRKQITIAGNTGIISEDFVGSYLQKSGLGAVIITAVKEDGSFDPNGRLYATSRIWSTQPGTNGTVSQSFPVIAASSIQPARELRLLGHRISTQFRSNVGLVNLAETEQSFDILQISADTVTAPVKTTVTVPSFGMMQVSLQNVNSEALQIVIAPQAFSLQSPWLAYGSTVDNVTGDSWSSLAFSAGP